jgi:hypothetical protein
MKKGWQVRTQDEAAEMALGSPEPACEVRQVVEEGVDIEGTAIGELVLEKLPCELIGIELWGVGGEAFNMEARMAGEHLLHVGPAVDGAAIPEQDDGAAKMAQQQPQEHRDLHVGDVLHVQMAVESEPSVGGADRHRRDGRDLVALVAMDQPRRLPPGRPGPAHGGHQQEAALVQEGQVRPQAPGFFKPAPTCAASSGRWRPRRAPGRAAPASGTSSPGRPGGD